MINSRGYLPHLCLLGVESLVGCLEARIRVAKSRAVRSETLAINRGETSFLWSDSKVVYSVRIVEETGFFGVLLNVAPA